MPHLAAVVVSALLHLQLTPSAIQSLHAGTISKIYVNGRSDRRTFAVTAEDTTAHIDDIAPGTWKVHVLFTMPGQTYMVYETTIDVPSSAFYETTFDIPAVVVVGKVTDNGVPVRGQMHLSLSEHRPGNWGFAVGFDKEGRFEFPLPKTGEWDIDVWDSDSQHLAKIRGAKFDRAANNVEISLPAGIVTTH